MSERVLVIPSEEILQIVGNSEGIINVEYSTIQNVISQFGVFIDRDRAESDENYRQVIPYVVMKEQDKFLVLRRTTRQGEKRLHNKISLGVGGHINRDDNEQPWQAFLKGMEREINEEVRVRILNLSYLGLINDLSSPVSRVHVGIAFVADVIFEGLNEPDMFTYTWCKLSELAKFLQHMEGWSYIVFQELRRLMQN